MKTWLIVLLFVSAALPACEPRHAEGAAAPSPPVAFGVVRGNQAKDLVSKGATLLDVRTPREFAAGHIEGAVNIPVNELGARIGELDKTRPAVVYCESGYRSSNALGVMKKEGFAQVYDLGGKSNW